MTKKKLSYNLHIQHVESMLCVLCNEHTVKLRLTCASLNHYRLINIQSHLHTNGPGSHARQNPDIFHPLALIREHAASVFFLNTYCMNVTQLSLV